MQRYGSLIVTMVFVYSLTRRRWRQKSIDKQTRVATRFDKRLFLGASLFRRSVPRKRGTRRLSISKCPDRFHSDCLMSRNSTRRGNRLHKRSGRILAQLARQKSLGIVGGRGGGRSTNGACLSANILFMENLSGVIERIC